VRARARLNTTLADGIVAARHGQACPNWTCPATTALGADGANINLAIGVEATRSAAPPRTAGYPLSGSKGWLDGAPAGARPGATGAIKATPAGGTEGSNLSPSSGESTQAAVAG